MRPGDNKWSCSSSRATPTTARRSGPTRSPRTTRGTTTRSWRTCSSTWTCNGKPRKLLIHPGRTGFVFVLDRGTGELLSAEKLRSRPTGRTATTSKTGKPHEDPTKRTHARRRHPGHLSVVDRRQGLHAVGVLAAHRAALHPRAQHCMDYEGIEANYIAGTPYLGASVRCIPGPGGYQGELSRGTRRARRRCGA